MSKLSISEEIISSIYSNKIAGDHKYDLENHKQIVAGQWGPSAHRKGICGSHKGGVLFNAKSEQFVGSIAITLNKNEKFDVQGYGDNGFHFAIIDCSIQDIYSHLEQFVTFGEYQKPFQAKVG